VAATPAWPSPPTRLVGSSFSNRSTDEHLAARVGAVRLSVLHQRLRDEQKLKISWASFYRYGCVNVMNGRSFLAVGQLAARIGLLNRIVYTQAKSSVLLMLVPLMPTPWLAVLCIFLRATMSEMDVPSRKSYSIAFVDPDERTATAGITIRSARSPAHFRRC